MLRRLRIGISALLFVLISFFFLDFAEILPNSFHRLAHLQFIPAVLSLSIGILLFLIVLTLLFGRVYCSTICPMGILQDVIARISKSTGKKKKRYSYSPAKNKLRWGILGLTVIGFLCGFTFIVGLLDPYSAYGRVVVHIFKPIYMLGNNLLESVFSKFDNYTFYQVDTSVLSISSLFIAVITLAVIFVMAWKHGRTWCNTVCPVGTVLGLLSRFSLFKVRIDTTKCNGCGLCATKCKASCINSKEHAIDYSRCVDCFDCLGACKQKALVYNPSLKKQQANVEAPVPSSPDTDSSKRRFFGCRSCYCRGYSQTPVPSQRIRCKIRRQEGIQKRESNHSSGLYQSGTLSTAMYILSSLCQQMPFSCPETCFYGVWFGRHNAADR